MPNKPRNPLLYLPIGSGKLRRELLQADAETLDAVRQHGTKARRRMIGAQIRRIEQQTQLPKIFRQLAAERRTQALGETS